MITFHRTNLESAMERLRFSLYPEPYTESLLDFYKRVDCNDLERAFGVFSDDCTYHRIRLSNTLQHQTFSGKNTEDGIANFYRKLRNLRGVHIVNSSSNGSMDINRITIPHDLNKFCKLFDKRVSLPEANLWSRERERCKYGLLVRGQFLNYNQAFKYQETLEFKDIWFFEKGDNTHIKAFKRISIISQPYRI